MGDLIYLYERKPTASDNKRKLPPICSFERYNTDTEYKPITHGHTISKFIECYLEGLKDPYDTQSNKIGKDGGEHI